MSEPAVCAVCAPEHQWWTPAGKKFAARFGVEFGKD
jgi:hypothetical protein